MAFKLSDHGVPSHALLLGLGDVLEGVALHRHDGGHLSLVRRHLVKLLVQPELEVHRPELDQLVEQGGGPADIPHLRLLVVGHLGRHFYIREREGGREGSLHQLCLYIVLGRY